MQPFWNEHFANPSSSAHAAGRLARDAVERAREQVASLIGAASHEIVLTSGATEANNLTILGLAGAVRQKGSDRNRLVTTVLEHASVREPAKALARQGMDVTYIPATEEGILDLVVAEKQLTSRTFLVSVQRANNEIGTLQPVREVVSLAREVGAVVHCDATQAVGKIPVDVNNLDVDFLSLSGHKFYGPKGVGALFIRGGPSAWPLIPLMVGGGQEQGMTPGTVNVPAVVGLGAACEIASQEWEYDTKRLVALRDAFEHQLQQAIPQVQINGCDVPRLPGASSLTIPGTEADALLAQTPQLILSTGSACASGAWEPSPVLTAIGLTQEAAWSTIRCAVGKVLRGSRRPSNCGNDWDSRPSSSDLLSLFGVNWFGASCCLNGRCYRNLAQSKPRNKWSCGAGFAIFNPLPNDLFRSQLARGAPHRLNSELPDLSSKAKPSQAKHPHNPPSL